MIEFLKKEKRNDKEMTEFILSLSRRQTTDLSKINITSFSDFLEDLEKSENPCRNNRDEVPEEENEIFEKENFLTIKFPFLKNSILNDFNDNNINETKIKSFIYN